ncbi:MAG: 16S rRNA (guanine(527)-N(7))-methyltransferase RsmG [Clostridia bacterium]|nr:16S rRNA (guanine(527)-N(7))-methyltransferase RsmG [Clostridia bacterium]
MTDFLRASIEVLCPERAEVLTALALRTAETATRMNITARKSEAEVVFYHVADSLSLLPDVRGARRVCDVGTGGGFPGLVLAALCPETEFVLMDATQKKVRAVAETAAALGLNNVTGLCARAEEAGQDKWREKFDVVVSRALAALPMLSELCLPLLRVGGRFVSMKGPRYAEELADAKAILQKLGQSAPLVRTETLDKNAFLTLSAEPTEEELCALTSFCEMERHTLVFEKKRPTPRTYPRPFAQIRRGN